MNGEALGCACKISQQLLLNCYLREADSGEWHRPDDCALPQAVTVEGDFVVELDLAAFGQQLLIDVSYRSLVGRHHFGKVWLVNTQTSEAYEIGFTVLASLLAGSLTQGQTSKLGAEIGELDFVANALCSSRAMLQSVEAADARDLQSLEFSNSEQNGVFGHWFHPCPMNRIGMAKWQEQLYSPEFEGNFQLFYFAVAQEHFLSAGIASSEYNEYLQGCFGDELPVVPEGFMLIATHPLQAAYLKSDSYVQKLLNDGALLEIGVAGKKFAATSSVRSVYSPDLEMMMKLSIPVKITNSVRTNKFRDLEYCRLMSKVYQSWGMNEFSETYEFILDFAYCSIKHPEREDESGFEVLLRQNPFQGDAGKNVLNPVALFQDPIPGAESQLATIVGTMAADADIPLELAAQQWFEDYVDCSLLQLIQVYDRFGVVFESHLQNCLIQLDAGRPSKLFSRDTEGGYITNDLEQELLDQFPELSSIDAVFFDEAEMFKVVAYYLLSNHMFAVVHRFGADRLLSEELSIELMARKLEKFTHAVGARGKNLISYLLNSEVIECKSNLLTQFRGIDELDCSDSSAVYVEIANPLHKCIGNKAMEKQKAEVIGQQ